MHLNCYFHIDQTDKKKLLAALSQQQGPNIWISSIFISAFHANIGKKFPLNMIIRVSDQFKTLNFLIF